MIEEVEEALGSALGNSDDGIPFAIHGENGKVIAGEITKVDVDDSAMHSGRLSNLHISVGAREVTIHDETSDK